MDTTTTYDISESSNSNDGPPAADSPVSFAVPATAAASQQPAEQETSASGRPLRNRRQTMTITQSSQFLEDFDPEQSSRERRKHARKSTTGGTSTAGSSSAGSGSGSTGHRQSILNERGHYRATGLDACDCLDNDCPGCHFPCESCGSRKCDATCRVNRRWVVQVIKHDGKSLEIHNPNLVRGTNAPAAPGGNKQ